MIRHRIFLGCCLAAVVLSGCSQQTITSASQDMSRNIASANQAVDRMGQQAKPELTKLDLGARVTAALRANANLPHTIRVDGGSTGVRLRGTVRTAAQKHLAGSIAKDTLPASCTVQNQLQITS